MSISSWFPWRRARQHKGRSRPTRAANGRRCGTRLAVEQLENRTVLSNYTAATVPELIAAINTANSTPVADAIKLAAGTTFTLTQVNNTTNGATGLPTIAAAGGPLTIQGNGDTIERSTSTAADFRLFDVAPGASLTLANVTLQGGLAVAGGGGAILNQGTLDLIAVTVQNNRAYVTGGGIYSSGALTLEGGTIVRGNAAVGAYGVGYGAFGGGVYVAGGTMTVTNATVSSNSARGISDSFGAGADGGGLYVGGGTVTLTNATVSSNSAVGGDANGDRPPSISGSGRGGGVYVADGIVSLMNSTLSSNLAAAGEFYGPNAYNNGPGVAAGGGLYVGSGTVTMTNSIVSSNSAVGGASISTSGGGAVGGGLWVGGSSMVTLTDSILSSNSAVGGAYYGSGKYGPGVGLGGGLYAAGGTVTLRNDTVTANSATDGAGGKKNSGNMRRGGGLYIARSASVYLDAFTVAHTTGNTPDNINGSYTLIT